MINAPTMRCPIHGNIKMNVAMALWGAMSGGGPELSGPALRDQIILDTALTP